MDKNIMFVMNQMTSGGAERVVSILANEMIRKNNRVSLVITFEGKVHYDLESEIELIQFNISRELNEIKRNIIEIKKLVSVFKLRKPDVVISFIRNVNCIIAAKIVGIPIIISERNNPIHDPKNKVWRLARKIIYPYATAIVFQTNGAKNYFNRYIRNKGYIIENPLTNYIPKREIELIRKEIVTVGRLTKQKDQETLIKAFAIFKKRNPEYNLIIYGDGELREDLQKIINNLDLENCVSMPGSKKDIHEKIKSAEMFVLSSRYEGYPNALIEAMAIGMPVISTNCKYGPEEIIKNNVNGFLVETGDFCELSNVMEIIVNNKKLSKEISYNAMLIRDRLDSSKITDKWLELIFKIT